MRGIVAVRASAPCRACDPASPWRRCPGADAPAQTIAAHVSRPSYDAQPLSGHCMDLLLRWAHRVDTLNRLIGRAMAWPVIGAIVVSAGNAISRKFFGVSSNAWLEVQWHLFALSSL